MIEYHRGLYFRAILMVFLGAVVLPCVLGVYYVFEYNRYNTEGFIHQESLHRLYYQLKGAPNPADISTWEDAPDGSKFLPYYPKVEYNPENIAIYERMSAVREQMNHSGENMFDAEYKRNLSFIIAKYSLLIIPFYCLLVWALTGKLPHRKRKI